MSLEAIEKVTLLEQQSQERKAAAEAEARQIVADAEREGLALLQQVRAEAAANGRKLLREAEEKAQAEAVAEKLKSCQVKIRAKAGQGGKLFGSVTSKEISEALKEQHQLDVNKSKIVQADPIKAFGSYEIKCKLGYEVGGTINVLVVEEK